MFFGWTWIASLSPCRTKDLEMYEERNSDLAVQILALRENFLAIY